MNRRVQQRCWTHTRVQYVATGRLCVCWGSYVYQRTRTITLLNPDTWPHVDYVFAGMIQCMNQRERSHCWTHTRVAHVASGGLCFAWGESVYEPSTLLSSSKSCQCPYGCGSVAQRCTKYDNTARSIHMYDVWLQVVSDVCCERVSTL